MKEAKKALNNHMKEIAVRQKEVSSIVSQVSHNCFTLLFLVDHFGIWFPKDRQGA